MHLRVVLRHTEWASIDAVATVQATRLQRGHHDAFFRYLDCVSRTHQRAGRFVAMHTNRRHRSRGFSAVNVVHEDHRVTFVRRTFAARSYAGAATNATLRIDEHRLFHLLPQ